MASKKQLEKVITKSFHEWSIRYEALKNRCYFTVFREKMIYDFIEKSLWSGECLNLFDLDEAYPFIEKASQREESALLFKMLYHEKLPLLCQSLSPQYSLKDLLALPAEVIGAYLITLEMLPNQNEGLKRVQAQLQTDGLRMDFNSSSYIRPNDDFNAEEITENVSSNEK